MPITESIHITESSTKTYVISHMPAGALKGIIILVHGLGEHIRRYDQQLSYFNDQGYGVIGADLIGHGRTEGVRGTWKSMESNYHIIDHLFIEAARIDPTLPVFLYGHSMGGNIAARYVVIKNPGIRGLILTGPAIKTPKDLPSFLVRAVMAAPEWIKNIRIPNGLDLSSLCTDEDVVRQYIADPLVHNRVSLGAGATILDNAETLLSHTWIPPFPVLMMHGADDRITLPSGTESLKNKWSGKVDLKIWPGMLHEIHNEKEKRAVWQFTIDWLDQIVS